jgi:septum formation inhibitor-activating ATPase MinD
MNTNNETLGKVIVVFSFMGGVGRTFVSSLLKESFDEKQRTAFVLTTHDGQVGYQISDSLSLADYVNKQRAKHDVVIIDAPIFSESVADRFRRVCETADAVVFVVNNDGIDAEHANKVLRSGTETWLSAHKVAFVINDNRPSMIMNEAPGVIASVTKRQPIAAIPYIPEATRRLRYAPSGAKPNEYGIGDWIDNGFS